MTERAFTMSDQTHLEFLPGYYWIRRSEPDGPPEWEVARFDGRVWWTTGSGYSKLPTRDPNASNAWKIGERVERGEVDAERARCADIAKRLSEEYVVHGAHFTNLGDHIEAEIRGERDPARV